MHNPKKAQLLPEKLNSDSLPPNLGWTEQGLLQTAAPQTNTYWVSRTAVEVLLLELSPVLCLWASTVPFVQFLHSENPFMFIVGIFINLCIALLFPFNVLHNNA